MMSCRISRCLAGLAVLILFAGQALAQPSGARGDDFIYQVRAGDTLGGLSDLYTSSQSNWQRLQQLNNVAQDTLLSVSRELRIPFALIPEVASVATVDYVVGDARLNGQPLRAGGQIAEGDLVLTGRDAYLSLTLADGSSLSIPPLSTLEFSRLRAFEKTGLIDAIITVKEGSIEALVAPDDTGVGRFEVRNPVSITGVRGTRLRVHASSQGSHTELVSGRAEVDASQSPSLNLSAAQGVVVTAQGEASGVRRLLPAPNLTPPHRGSTGVETVISPVAGASTYLVSVVGKADGSQLVSQKQVPAGPVQLQAPGPGIWHVLVRAIDDVGLGGLDATASFEGRSVLLASDGSSVSTAYGLLVELAY